MALSSSRHSRPVELVPVLHGGNPGSFRRISLDTRSPIKVGDKLRGYDGRGDIFVFIPRTIFKGGHESFRRVRVAHWFDSEYLSRRR